VDRHNTPAGGPPGRMGPPHSVLVSDRCLRGMELGGALRRKGSDPVGDPDPGGGSMVVCSIGRDVLQGKLRSLGLHNCVRRMEGQAGDRMGDRGALPNTTTFNVRSSFYGGGGQL